VLAIGIGIALKFLKIINLPVLLVIAGFGLIFITVGLIILTFHYKNLRNEIKRRHENQVRQYNYMKNNEIYKTNNEMEAKAKQREI
jgi:hypothetical protein